MESSLLIIQFLYFREDVELTDPESFERLFGVGTKDLAESDKLNNTALSVEDLYILQELNPCKFSSMASNNPCIRTGFSYAENLALHRITDNFPLILT